jgi:hypothetical protein
MVALAVDDVQKFSKFVDRLCAREVQSTRMRLQDYALAHSSTYSPAGRILQAHSGRLDLNE